MSTAQKAFEAEMFAKNHYRKLLTAKSSVRQLKNRGSQAVQSVSKTITPLDRYEYHNTNTKICSKLTEIYKCPETSFRKYRRSKQKNTKSLNEQHLRDEGRSIKKTNLQIFQRILCAKSMVAQDWKQRERKLKKYNKLTRKKLPQNCEILFEAYQHLMLQSRHRSARPNRSKSSRGRPSSSSDRSSKEIDQTL